MAVGAGEGIKKEESRRGPKSRGQIEFCIFCNEKRLLKVAPGTARPLDANPRFNPTGLT